MNSKKNIQKISEFAEKAYLNYAMSVILDRALPNICDGLKPVQRRIVYAMSELGLKANNKYKKSARTIGDVLGKYHPHGDSACYEAMVLMAQNFSYRYPIIDGQGNWGTLDDPKSFAAMRYTESKLSNYANLLLSEIEQNTVSWVSNFDGTIDEPKVLPAQVPNILLNGATGIAVGMSTDIPPHNLREVIKACILLLEKSNANLDEIMQCIPAPDFPTGGEIITPKEHIKSIYQTGNGSIKIRAKYKKKDNQIVIYELPYRSSASELLVQIAKQIQDKSIPVINLRDESDYTNPIRLVLELRSKRTDAHSVMGHLFATTDLEKSYRINLNCIGINGKPQVKPLTDILKEWLIFRLDCTKKRLNYRLGQIISRLHIIDGLLLTLLNIDEVIQIIRNEDEPQDRLIERFKLSEQQAKSILSLQLRYISKLEETKLTTEQANLAREKISLDKIISNETNLNKYAKQQLTTVANDFGDERMSLIVEREEAKPIEKKVNLTDETYWVYLSVNGWIRSSKTQLDNLKFKSGDEHLQTIVVSSKNSISFLDEKGRSYSTEVVKLPSAKGQSEPLTSRFTIENGAKVIGMISGKSVQKCLLASSSGYGFSTDYANFVSNYKTGKSIINVDQNSRPLPPSKIYSEQEWVVAITSEPKILVFPISQLANISKGKGIKLINLKGEHKLLGVSTFSTSDILSIKTKTSIKKFKWQELERCCGNRAARGKDAPPILKNTTAIIVERNTTAN